MTLGLAALDTCSLQPLECALHRKGHEFEVKGKESGDEDLQKDALTRIVSFPNRP